MLNNLNNYLMNLQNDNQKPATKKEHMFQTLPR